MSDVIQNDAELDAAIARVDALVDKSAVGPLSRREQAELDKLADRIYEYEERTDILNRPVLRTEQ